MSAVLGYHLALLLRSQRWVPPLILYAGFSAVGVRPGQPILDSLGFTAAATLPMAGWLVRICATNEPAAARGCVAAGAGAVRAHLGCLLAALLAAVALGAVATLFVVLISDPANNDGTAPVPRRPAAGAGLLAMLVCALLGAAAGALTSRPLLHRTGRAVPALLLALVVVLITTGSPVRTALSDLVTGSQDGTVRTPALPLLLGAVIAAAAGAVACALAPRRD
ncbi:ABC transporter [Streptomyces sp. NPDC050560]|uniref:ABC transporter n=1 Tax=Streptomyces sp. NPDC050560 TaxID=3365630 RepID=UPI0037984BF6